MSEILVESPTEANIVVDRPGGDVAVRLDSADRSVIVQVDSETSLVIDRVIGDVTVAIDETEEIVRFDEGVEGPAGPRGATGPQGLPGRLPEIYDLAQVSSWTQAHGFAYLPEVRLILSDGETALCAASYPDSTRVHIQFPQPFTGKVVLS